MTGANRKPGVLLGAPHPSPAMARRDADARAVAARVARESYGKLVAYLAAASRDVPGAEDALADAFASALAVWPNQGRPRTRKGGSPRPRVGASSTLRAEGVAPIVGRKRSC